MTAWGKGTQRLLELERHPLGPRLFVLGRRLHEWHLGTALVGLSAVAWSEGVLRLTPERALFVVLVGAWLVIKDWRDFFPGRRDRAAWQLGLHRPPVPLRTLRHADSVPAIAAAVAAAIGVVNLVWALGPHGSWLDDLVPQIRPLTSIPVFHSLALPAAVCLIVCAVNLHRRRRSAWALAFGLLVVLAVLHLAESRDLVEAAISAAGASGLWLGRRAFYVRRRRSAAATLARIGVLLGGSLAAALTVALVTVHAEPSVVAPEGARLILWQHPGPVPLSDEAGALPPLARALSLAILLACAYLLFRRPGALVDPPAAALRRAARTIVRRHGSDTLAFFKLRRDLRYLFAADRGAFLGYRIEAGVLLMCGDPVGPPGALPELLRSVCRLAEEHGLRVAGIGASAPLLPLYAQAGLRSFYLGDEAIVETERFSLEGRAIRKVRQSVSRLERAGYSADLHELGAYTPAQVAELERVSESWRRGRPERGFSMALDGIRPAEHRETLVTAARDAGGTIRGFLHFVPAHGRAAVSLSAMRFERGTPNGLTEFLIVKAIEQLRQRGVAEVSLNFAAFAALLHDPRDLRERLLGAVVRRLNPYFQIESLYRFNAKFFPRWESRFLVYEGRLGLPRAALAALWAEGQLPRPRAHLATFERAVPGVPHQGS